MVWMCGGEGYVVVGMYSGGEGYVVVRIYSGGDCRRTSKNFTHLTCTAFHKIGPFELLMQ